MNGYVASNPMALMYTVSYFNHFTDKIEITHVLANSNDEAIMAVWNASRFSNTVDILKVSDIKVTGWKGVGM